MKMLKTENTLTCQNNMLVIKNKPFEIYLWKMAGIVGKPIDRAHII